MAHVFLNGNLKILAGGKAKFEVQARTVKHLFKELSLLYPDLEPHLSEGIAVAIDGQVFQDAWLEEILPDSEVHLFPQIGGG